jgi:hypothetical protein
MTRVRKAVVGERESAALGGVEERLPDHRNLGEAQLLCGLPAAVAGDDHILLIGKDRDRKAEPLDVGGQLLDLLVRMLAGVSRVGGKGRGGQRLDLGMVVQIHGTAPSG